ncbi:hypothetical protein ACIO87_23255 [Streptomyces sp. NPDC087218]|uniref:hypothetical protein n=1 Tax=Streptomyces sp. NPDC087218 TaxID=3365769 RepID=UPI003810227B
MYLIHVRLGPPQGESLPSGVSELIQAVAVPGDGLEHVAVHPETAAGPVLGLFITADHLEAAEATAAALCLRAVGVCPDLRGFEVLAWHAEMVPQFYEHLAGALADGQLMPTGNPSTGNLFHPF